MYYKQQAARGPAIQIAKEPFGSERSIHHPERYSIRSQLSNAEFTEWKRNALAYKVATAGLLLIYFPCEKNIQQLKYSGGVLQQETVKLYYLHLLKITRPFLFIILDKSYVSLLGLNLIVRRSSFMDSFAEWKSL